MEKNKEELETKPEITLESLYGDITDKIINNANSKDKTEDKDKDKKENYLYKIGFFILLLYIVIRAFIF